MESSESGIDRSKTEARLRRVASASAGAGCTRRIAAGLTGVALTLSCGGETAAPTPGPPPPPPPPPPQPTTLSIAPDSVRLTALDATAQLSADLRDQNGRPMTGVSIDWAASDTLVATVTGSGLVRSTGPGAATITATAGGLSATASVTVEQVVAEVVVTPPAPTVFEGDTLRLAAEARDANDYHVPDVVFVWTSDYEAVATVDSAGLAQAVAQGTATITARTGEVSGTAAVTVTRRSIPPNPDVDVGTSHSLQSPGMRLSHPEIRFGRGGVLLCQGVR
ncbi:Ig-like domain-containing protein [Candidatus Palauibacter sp.]|uniref:Ig-like domain-containing protein n=1 Tax=Candidatus Palauibacter sp. TaxID=3101350 RepID=UPI003AF28243